jgi:hypothetical protein
MKKLLTSRFKKSKKGESSSHNSHHTKGTHERRDEEESHHQVVLYEPPPRVREPGSGLMLTQEELQKYNTLRSSSFRYTSIIDPVLLDHTGMSAEFNAVFNTIGWGGFWMVPELGIEVITQDFLCTLQLTFNGVAFHMFREKCHLTWSILNTTLGCEHNCELDLDHATIGFRKMTFGKQYLVPTIALILHPTKSIT